MKHIVPHLKKRLRNGDFKKNDNNINECLVETSSLQMTY